MSRRPIWLRLLVAGTAAALAAVAMAAALLNLPSRPAVRFAASRAFTPVEFSSDGSRLLGRSHRSGELTDVLALWDVSTGEQLARYTDLPRQVRLTPDGRLAFVDEAGGLVIRDPATGRTEATPVIELRADVTPIFSPDGKLVAINDWGPGGINWQVRVCDLPGGTDRVRIVRNLPRDPTGSAHFSADGSQLGVLSGREVRIWDTRTRAERARYLLKPGVVPERGWLNPTLDTVVLTGSWSRISSSADDDVHGNNGEETTLWHLPPASGNGVLASVPRLVKKIGFTQFGNEVRFVDPSVRICRPFSVTMTDQGRVLITQAGNKGLVVWALDEEFRQVGFIPGCGDGIVSPDGQFVATGVSDFGGIELWLVTTPPPTPLAAGVAITVGLLAGAFAWWLTGRPYHPLVWAHPP
jgi:hypothetical protein